MKKNTANKGDEFKLPKINRKLNQNISIQLGLYIAPPNVIVPAEVNKPLKKIIAEQ